MVRMVGICFFLFKQKTAYELRISDWSSYVCSSDLRASSRQAIAAPIGPQVMPYRAWVRQPSGPLRPLTLGSRLASGTRTLSKNSAEVTDARRLILCLISCALKPAKIGRAHV